MAEIKLGPQDDDESPEEVLASVEQPYILELMAQNTDLTYGPMSRKRAVQLASEMLYAIGGEVAVRLSELTPYANEED
jgi:hypothetical protein